MAPNLLNAYQSKYALSSSSSKGVFSRELKDIREYVEEPAFNSLREKAQMQGLQNVGE